jgi:hypothetical protein
MQEIRLQVGRDGYSKGKKTNEVFRVLQVLRVYGRS